MYPLTNATVNIDNVKATGFKSHYGGVIYATDFATVSIANSEFNNNDVDRKGGVIYVDKSSLIAITTSSFANNSAEGGGVLYATSKAKVKLQNVTIDNNLATSSIPVTTSSYIIALGGAIYVTDYAQVETITTNITNNIAPMGGAIYVSDEGKFLAGKGTYIARNENARRTTRHRL